MAVYGVDFYGKVKYGPNVEVDFSVQPFYVVTSDYNKVVLTWTPPSNVSAFIRLVRNNIGWPSREDDGIILLTNDISKQGAISSYTDTDVLPGHFYYYGIFAALHPAWDATATYTSGTVVGSNGKFYTAADVEGNLGQLPGASGTYWNDSSADSNWVVAGAVSTLVVADNGYLDRMYSLIPRPYKGADSYVTEVADDNPALYEFLRTFAYHFDEIRTNYDSLLEVNNWLRATEPQAQSLAAQFGVDNDPTLPAHFRRTRLRDSAHLYREKGTEGGLRGIINASLGWDARIVVGPNLMLNDDQANFAHPRFNMWDATINYAGPSATPEHPTIFSIPGHRIQYNGNIYEAKAGGAYGDAQRPSGVPQSNTWWLWITNDLTNSALYNPTTGGVSTWGARSYTGTVTPLPGGLALAVGLPDAFNSGVQTNNAGYVKNTSGQIVDLGVESVTPVLALAWKADLVYAENAYVTYADRTFRSMATGNTGVIPGTDAHFWAHVYIDATGGIDFVGQVVKDGIPTPLSVSGWTSDVTFKAGDITAYRGSDYQAIISSVNRPPTGRPNNNIYWQYLGPDQDAYTASGFITMPIGGTSSNTKMGTTWYTDRGGLLGRLAAPTNLTYVDTFDDLAPKSSRMNVPLSGGYAGAASWKETNGTWPSIYGWVYPQPAKGLSAVTNLLINPSFEVDTTYWSAVASAFTAAAGATITRDTTQYLTSIAGAASARINANGAAANQGISATSSGITANTTYTVSAYVKLVSGRPITLRIKDVTNAVTVSAAVGYINPTGWTRITATLTTGSLTPSGGILAAIHTDATTGTPSVFYVDAVQVEAGGAATAYIDGINGGRWLGAPNASASVRVTNISIMHTQSYRSDIQVAMTFRTFPPGKSEGMVFRMLDGGNFWAANWHGLFYYVNGVATGYAYPGGPVPNGTRIIVQANGTSVRAYKYLPAKPDGSPNLQLLMSMVSTVLLTATRVGIYTEI